MKILAASALALTAALTHACCIASDGTKVSLVQERALIIWDAKKGVEHFVRQASFDTLAKDFGFIVPTPSVPTLALAKTDMFNKIDAFINTKRPASIGCAAAKAGDTGAAAGIEVLKEQQIGDYHAAVVKASNATELTLWLKKNGYVSRSAMTDWLDHYIAKKWVFTALKYTGKKDGMSQTNAVRLSFPTDKPHFPYKMPKDTWPDQWYRPLSIAFVSTGAMDSKYVGKGTSWEARQVWSGPLNPFLANAITRDCGLKPEDLPDNAVLSYFENSTNAQGYDADLVFETKQASLFNPATAMVGAFIGVVVAFFTRRKRKTKLTA